MTKKTVKKSMDFPSEEDYARLKAGAAKNQQKIGEFIVTILEFWEKHQKERID